MALGRRSFLRGAAGLLGAGVAAKALPASPASARPAATIAPSVVAPATSIPTSEIPPRAGMTPILDLRGDGAYGGWGGWSVATIEHHQVKVPDGILIGPSTVAANDVQAYVRNITDATFEIVVLSAPPTSDGRFQWYWVVI